VKASPTLRFWVRSLVVAVLTFFVSALAQGGGAIHDWQTFVWGLCGGVAYAILGLVGPQ
jgi:hypothetical protein